MPSRPTRNKHGREDRRRTRVIAEKTTLARKYREKTECICVRCNAESLQLPSELCDSATGVRCGLCGGNVIEKRYA